MGTASDALTEVQEAEELVRAGPPALPASSGEFVPEEVHWRCLDIVLRDRRCRKKFSELARVAELSQEEAFALRTDRRFWKWLGGEVQERVGDHIPLLLWDLCELAMDGKQPVSARIQAAKVLMAADLAAGNSPKRMQSILNIVSQVPANTKVEAASDGQNVAVRVERGAHEELLREGAQVGAIEAAGKPRGELKPSAQSQLMDRLMAAGSSEDSA